MKGVHGKAIMGKEKQRQREYQRAAMPKSLLPANDMKSTMTRHHDDFGKVPAQPPTASGEELSRPCNGIMLKPGQQGAEREVAEAADEAEIVGHHMMRGEAKQEQRRGDGGGDKPYPGRRAGDEDHLCRLAQPVGIAAGDDEPGKDEEEIDEKIARPDEGAPRDRGSGREMKQRHEKRADPAPRIENLEALTRYRTGMGRHHGIGRTKKRGLRHDPVLPWHPGRRRFVSPSCDWHLPCRFCSCCTPDENEDQ